MKAAIAIPAVTAWAKNLLQTGQTPDLIVNNAAQWAPQAAEFFLGLGPEHNGQSLSI